MVERPGWSGSPSARATVTGTKSGSVIGARSTYQIPSLNSSASWLATCIASRVLPAPPAPVKVTSRFSASSSRTWVSCASRPTKLVSCTGRCCETTLLRLRSGGKSLTQIGMAQLHHPLRAGQTAQRMSAQIGQPHVGGQPVDDQRLGRTRQHRLAAVGQIAQPRRAVDGRADVVALVAQLHLAGVHADPQAGSAPAAPAATPAHTPPHRTARANATTKLSPSPCSTGRTPS